MMEKDKESNDETVEQKVVPIIEDYSDIHALMYNNDKSAEDVYQTEEGLETIKHDL